MTIKSAIGRAVMRKLRPSIFLVVCGVIVVYSVLHIELVPSLNTAEALPQYTVRSGRTCDNCHVDPEGWENPALPWRKCNLSCMDCHINPTGGGPRTVSGRYYGQSTLPMFLPSYRPHQDQQRLFSRFLTEKGRNRIHDLAVGTPHWKQPRNAFAQERYGGLHATPILLGGVDFRMAAWAFEDGALAFPMQLDTHFVLHPSPYFTIHVTGGLLGKSAGFVSTFDLSCNPDVDGPECLNRARGTFFALKDVSFMVHELPMMSYVRVGRFIPPFGTMFDDHTLGVRRDFEMDQGLLNSRVTGGEIGMAPNYPYFHLAVFRPNRQDTFLDNPDATSIDSLPPFFGVPGWGIASSFGWRDLGFQVGASVMVRRRDLIDGGDTESFALSWGFNPWYYVHNLPLTYLGELAMGYRRRLGSGTRTGQIALMHELNYLPFNGINFKFRHEYVDYDMSLAGDNYHRLGVGMDIIVLAGLELSAMARFRLNPGSDRTSNVDGIIQLRAWY